MVVDHVRPHRGSEALFWDEGNPQVLCGSPCHSKHKHAIERLMAYVNEAGASGIRVRVPFDHAQAGEVAAFEAPA
jgi:hypothetical protein